MIAFAFFEYEDISCSIKVFNNPVRVDGKTIEITEKSGTGIIEYYSFDKKEKYIYKKSLFLNSLKKGDVIDVYYAEGCPDCCYHSLWEEVTLTLIALLMVITCFPMFLYALVALISRELGLKRGNDDGADNLF
jgi:hypothetical protein